MLNLPVERIRDGYYSDAYFTFSKEVLEAEDHRPPVTMQVFQKKAALLGGVDEAIAILRLCSGRRLPYGRWEDGWDALTVRALHEGGEIAPRGRSCASRATTRCSRTSRLSTSGAWRGVNPRLFERVRRALDDAGHGRVRIVVSGWVRRRVHPRVRGARARVDSYGVGSALLRGANDFTADVVRLNGRECAKAGRCYVASDRLELVT